MKDNLVQQKSYDFALRAISLYRELVQRNEFVLSKQMLRSGTSIGANVEEALAGQSRADFLSKMSIASKEAREVRYWLRLLKDTETLPPVKITPFLQKRKASRPLHNYRKPAIMSYRRRPVSSIIEHFLDSGFHRNDE